MGQPRTHAQESEEVAAPFAIPHPAPSSISVLIADDNATNRKLLRTVLESHGHVVLEADSGVTALKFLDQRQVDAVISDILMPGMDGFRLCFEIRRNPKLRKLPFIVYTASYTSSSDENLALQFGADRFIRKPASNNTIVETLHDVVESVRNQEHIEVKIPEEAGVMRAYSQVLVSKLEQTIVSLSETNKALAERTALAEFAAAVSQAVSQETDLERMLRECCAATAEHLAAGSVRIWIMNERTNVLELQASSGTSGDNRAVPLRIPLGQSIIGLIAAEQKPHVTQDIIGDARMRDHEWARREGMTAFAGYPLIIADQLVGVMGTLTKTSFSQNAQAALGAAAGIIAVGIQRQLAEEKMRRNEARFRDLAENINEIFFVAEPNGGSVSYVSPAYEAITGRKREMLYQNPDAWLATIHADDRPRIERAFRDNSKSVNEEYRIIRPNGEIRWLRSRAFGVKNEQGKTARIVGIATDITEQKRAEAKVIEHLERIRALHEVDVAINSTLDLDTVLQVLLEKIDLFIPYPSVTTVRLRNPVTGHFEVLACRNIDAAEWKSEFIRSQGRAKRVMETKTPVTVRNLLTDPNTYNPDFYRRHGLISYASLPLVVRDEAIGVFNLYTKEEHEFSAEEVEFLLTLAGQAAVAINNARLHEHTQRHLRRIQGVSEINTAIASSLSLKNVLDVLLEKTELFCPIAVACGTRLFDEATGNMVPLASRHIPFEQWKQEVASAKGRLTRLLIETKRPVAILNMHTDSRTSMNQFARRHGLVSYLGVPLIVKDKVIGNLVIYTKKEYAFTVEEIEFFSNLGSQAAIAIHNAQLYEEARARETQLQDSNRMLAALHAVAAAANQSLDVNRVLQAAIGKVTEIFQFDATRIHLFEGESGQLVRRVSFEKDPARSAAPKPFKPSEGVIGKVAATGQALVFEDIDADPRYQELGRSEYSVRFHDRFVAVFPIRAKSGILGTLTCLGHAARNLSMAERQLLEAITDQVAAAIENARLFEKNEISNRELVATNRFLDKSLGQLTSLYTALTPLAPSESLGEMVSGIMERLVEATGADASLIRIWNRDAGDYPVIGQLGYPHAFIAGAHPERSEGAVGWVLKNNKPIIAADIASDARLKRKAQLRIGFQSCAILPLQVHGEVRGVIQLSSRKLRYFDNDQEYHLMAVARQMSIALENRELFYTLRTSRNELEKANKVKDEFLSVMSHELRTPLSVILGYIGMMRQKQLGSLTPEQDQAVDVIQRNSQELAAMVESIMDATKIESGSMVAETELISLPDLLAEIRLAYDFPLGKNIRMEWRVGDAPPAIWTDARKLRQILTNLINNAIKFTAQGEIVVSARQSLEPDDGANGNWIEFDVADSGIGIPAAEQQRIFERFHQVDGSGTRRFEGVGLGLYIVKSFAELLGGRISVRSELGKGSTFTVRLPVQTTILS